MRRTLRPIRLGAVGACLLVLASWSRRRGGGGRRPPGAALDGRLPQARGPGRAAAGGHDPGREDRPDDPGRARRRRDDPTLITDLAARLACCRAAARRRRRTRPRPGPTWSTSSRRRPWHPAADPADLRHRRRARPRQRGRRDGLPAQHRPGRDPRPARWSSGSAVTAAETRPPASSGTSRPASAWPATTLGPDLRELRRGPGAGRQDGDHDRRAAGPRAQLASPTAPWPPPSTTPATATPSTARAAGDYTIDQGITVTSRRDFARIDLSPYMAAVRRHDVGRVMPSFSSVDWTEDGSATR